MSRFGNRILLQRIEGRVIVVVVADQSAKAGLHFLLKRTKHRKDVLAFIVDGNDDVEFRGHRLDVDPPPVVMRIAHR